MVEHRYRPVGSALELFRSRDGEVLLSGAAGTGKSRGCLEKLHAMALRNPGMRGLVLRKTATSLTSTTLVTFREHVAKEAIDSGEVKWFGGSGQEPASYRYGNGSTITVGGMDKASRIMSSEYDIIYVAEATELSEEDWEAATTRLRNGKVSFQQIIADCNPDAPHHWLKQRCDRGQCKIIYCSHEDNPMLFVGGVWTDAGRSYVDRLDNLTGVRRERLRWGRWAAADGLVYDVFDPQVHVRDGFVMPPASWTRFWAVDFGFTNPFVCQFWAEDPDGRLYLYREIYRTQTLVEDHADAIKKLLRVSPGDQKPAAVVCDHDAEGRATLERELNVSTVPAHKSVLEGIEAVKSRLKVADDGKPRLFLCRDSVRDPDPVLVNSKRPFCTSQEILEYVWDNGKTKEQPVKSNDHGMDAMRYMVAYRDLVGRPSMRVLTW